MAAAGRRGQASSTAPVEPWLELLPRYAELQRGEAAHAAEHVASGVPELAVSSLPARYAELLEGDLPVEFPASPGSRSSAPSSRRPASPRRSSTTTSTERTSTSGTAVSECSIGATRPSRTRSSRWPSRSASSARARGSETRTSSPGAPVCTTSSSSLSESAGSRTRSPGRASATSSSPRTESGSTWASPRFCAARWNGVGRTVVGSARAKRGTRMGRRSWARCW